MSTPGERCESPISYHIIGSAVGVQAWGLGGVYDVAGIRGTHAVFVETAAYGLAHGHSLPAPALWEIELAYKLLVTLEAVIIIAEDLGLIGVQIFIQHPVLHVGHEDVFYH